MELNKKKKLLISIKRIALVIIGSAILAFGTGIFLEPSEIVAGGVSGIGIIVKPFITAAWPGFQVDIAIWVLNIMFLIVALIFLGKKFTIHTLIASLALPLFMTLFTRDLNGDGACLFQSLINEFKLLTTETAPGLTESEILVANGVKAIMSSICGGLCVGFGVAITFLGDGSTGGTDVLCFIIAKYTPVKQAVSSFATDALVIIVSLIVNISVKGQIFLSFTGILSAFICAVVIHFIYIQAGGGYIVDIISKKYKDISNYVIKEFNQTTTIIDAVGAYRNDKNAKMVRFVLDRRSFIAFKDAVANIDPKAFITVTSAKKVLGEGFSALRNKPLITNKKTKKNGK